MHAMQQQSTNDFQNWTLFPHDLALEPRARPKTAVHPLMRSLTEDRMLHNNRTHMLRSVQI
jgi:hypothetical protein